MQISIWCFPGARHQRRCLVAAAAAVPIYTRPRRRRLRQLYDRLALIFGLLAPDHDGSPVARR